MRGWFVAMVSLLIGTTAHLSAQAPVVADDDIRGPKPVIEIPLPKKPPLALGLGVAVGVLALGLGGWWWWRRRHRLRPEPPQGVALAALAELAANQEGMGAEAFASFAAHIVRHYIAGRFGLAAPRRTTEEFLRELASDGIPDLTAESDHLRAFLKSCDLAKFAGAQMDAVGRGELIETARGFIAATGRSSIPKEVTR